jgi:hypothetical protein
MSKCAFNSDEENYESQSPLKADQGKQKADEVTFQSFSPVELELETCREIGDVVRILGLEVAQFMCFLKEVSGDL